MTTSDFSDDKIPEEWAEDIHESSSAGNTVMSTTALFIKKKKGGDLNVQWQGPG